MKLKIVIADFKHEKGIVLSPETLSKGCTTCRLTDMNNNTVIGESRCSLKDNFSKKTGRKIALERAMSHLNLSKDERTTIWREYFKQVKL